MNNTPCLCGAMLPREELRDHKINCPFQRAAIIGEIKRIAAVLGHTPSMREYTTLRRKGIPSANNREALQSYGY